jgi:fatty-acid amide hydrolase 2
MEDTKTGAIFAMNHVVLKFFASIINTISSVTGLFIKPKKGCLPPVNNRLLLMDTQTLSRSIKKLEIKCEDVIQAYIDRIKLVNPLINALNDHRFEEALKEAKKIDINIKYEVENGSPSMGQESLLNKPLLGAPVTAKNSIFIQNLVNDSGLVKRKGIRASKNALVVENLNKAGAILLALTNVPELLIWYDSSNKVHGRTNNPYDLSRIPGGSSGGEAALISSAGSLCGIGSDIGGSIRIPSFFCGIWGHFPTPGIVPHEGMYPPPCKAWNNCFAFGPICRYASDIMPLLKAMAGNDAQKLTLDELVDFSKLVIYHIEDDGGNPFSSNVDPEIQTCMSKVKLIKLIYSLCIYDQFICC